MLKRLIDLLQYFQRLSGESLKSLFPSRIADINTATLRKKNSQIDVAIGLRKEKPVQPPVLRVLNWSSPLSFYTNVSEPAVKWSLTQNDANGIKCVICYFFKWLPKEKENYASDHPELLRLVHFLKHFLFFLKEQWVQSFSRQSGERFLLEGDIESNWWKSVQVS